VMATFPTPDRALAAALRMRHEMARINSERDNEDLLLKIGIHEGPCLAVTLNDRQDYFGQTVNIAARVQGLASSRAIFVTQPVIEDKRTANILQKFDLHPTMQRASLRGLADETTVYEIP
jgi:class 3 adenylate cyclase